MSFDHIDFTAGTLATQSIHRQTVPMTTDTLFALADRAALFTALRQQQLVAAVDELGEHRWDVDLEEGRFTFAATADPSRTVQATPHLIASIAPTPRSLMWAWALPQGDRSGLTERLRAYGQEHGIPALTEAEVPFPEDTGDDLDAWVTSFAHAVAGAAVEITGVSPYYLATSGGSKAVLLLEAPLEPLSVSFAVRTLPRVLSSLTLQDQRASVWDLARLASWRLEWVDADFSGAVVTDASGSATFSFDEQARISNIKGTLTGE